MIQPSPFHTTLALRQSSGPSFWPKGNHHCHPNYQLKAGTHPSQASSCPPQDMTLECNTSCILDAAQDGCSPYSTSGSDLFPCTCSVRAASSRRGCGTGPSPRPLRHWLHHAPRPLQQQEQHHKVASPTRKKKREAVARSAKSPSLQATPHARVLQSKGPVLQAVAAGLDGPRNAHTTRLKRTKRCTDTFLSCVVAMMHQQPTRGW